MKTPKPRSLYKICNYFSCYKMLKASQMTWKDAFEYCGWLGYQYKLLTVNSHEELMFMKEVLRLMAWETRVVFLANNANCTVSIFLFL